VDELLRYPQSAPLPSRARTAPRLRLPSLNGLRLPALPNFLERRAATDAALFLTASISLLSAGVLSCMICPSYRVTVDGVDLGLVSSYQAVDAAIGRVESRASRILGYDYQLHQTVGYRFQMSLREDVGTVGGIEAYLFDQIGEVMKASVLTVNGQVLGAADDDQALADLLDSIKAPYVNANTISAEFVEPVTVSREYTATTAIRELSDMAAVLTSNSMEQVDYTVQAGETFSGIANSHDMSMSQLQLLNPDVDINNLQIGQVLTISQAVPYLSVRTVDNVTYDAAVPYETEEQPDDSMYQGFTKVLTPGEEGFATYNADVTYLNGVEQARSVNSTQIHTEPVTEVVAVGTKPRPKTMATGSFQWPLYGTITSNYGSRYIFGSYSFHSGLDIAAPYGTAIAAADGGKVVFAGTGTGSNWSLGNYVRIDHENGLETVYAHCSSLNVSTGDRVYKGQTIARVGATGRATGSHCHFTVKSNGSIVSPWNYLP